MEVVSAQGDADAEARAETRAAASIGTSPLRDAVTARWLARLSEPLGEALEEQGLAAQRLRHWFDLLMASKRKSAHDDPELFATYMELVVAARKSRPGAC